MKVLPFTIPTINNASFLVQEERLESFYPYLHRHEEIQICWIRKGKGTLIVEADFYPFATDDVFIIAANSAHVFKNVETPFIESVSIFLHPMPESNPVMGLPEMQEIQKRLMNLDACNQLPADSIIHIKKILESTSIPQLTYLLQFLNETIDLVRLREESSLSYSDKSGDRLKIVMEYTLNHLHENIDLEKIAKQINFSPEAFCRFFKKRTRKTFVNYLNELRINEACRLLTEGEIAQVSNIAFQCGFKNVSHFNRVFKQIKKQPPLQFRKQYLGNLA